MSKWQAFYEQQMVKSLSNNQAEILLEGEGGISLSKKAEEKPLPQLTPQQMEEFLNELQQFAMPNPVE